MLSGLTASQNHLSIFLVLILSRYFWSLARMPSPSTYFICPLCFLVVVFNPVAHFPQNNNSNQVKIDFWEIKINCWAQPYLDQKIISFVSDKHFPVLQRHTQKGGQRGSTHPLPEGKSCDFQEGGGGSVQYGRYPPCNKITKLMYHPGT